MSSEGAAAEMEIFKARQHSDANAYSSLLDGSHCQTWWWDESHHAVE